MTAIAAPRSRKATATTGCCSRGGQDHTRHGQRHGGQPEAIRFGHDAGLDRASCSARRVPIARLAAVRAALQGRGA